MTPAPGTIGFAVPSTGYWDPSSIEYLSLCFSPFGDEGAYYVGEEDLADVTTAELVPVLQQRFAAARDVENKALAIIASARVEVRDAAWQASASEWIAACEGRQGRQDEGEEQPAEAPEASDQEEA